MSRILLVDDDNDMLQLTGRWLTKAGYEVTTATSGEEALDILSGDKPDLILLDVIMPGMDGPATFEAIRRRDELADIPIYFRTGKDEWDMLPLLSRLRPDGVVSKAEGKTELLKAVGQALQP